jgi:Ca2+-transporting ATPase
VTDGLPALALVMDPADPDSLRHPPRRTDDPMLGRREWALIAVIGLLHAATTLTVFVTALRRDGLGEARTLAFSTLVFGQLFLSLALRNPRRIFFGAAPFSNLALLAVVVLTVLLQLALPQLGATRRLFQIEALPVWPGLAPLAFGMVPVTVLELAKVVRGALTPTLSRKREREMKG